MQAEAREPGGGAAGARATPTLNEGQCPQHLCSAIYLMVQLSVVHKAVRCLDVIGSSRDRLIADACAIVVGLYSYTALGHTMHSVRVGQCLLT